MSGTRPPTHLGIVASLAPATGMHNQRTVELVLDCDEGNHALALRLADTFERLGYRCSLFDVHDQSLGADLTRKSKDEDIVAFIGIHLLRAGWPLLQQNVRPFVLIIGGTDVNEHALRPALCARMSQVISQAHLIIAMHPDLKLRFQEVWPEHARKLRVIRAAVHLSIPLVPSSSPSFRLHSALRLPPTSHIFLLPTNLRPVKDPLFLAAAFEAWHSTNNNVHLALIGPVLDEQFAEAVKKKISLMQAVHYHAAISAVAMQEAMQQAFAILNSSHSEGLSTAILEAMALERTVLARANVGNASLVKHNKTGLLFRTPEELIGQAQQLLQSPGEAKRLASNARRWVMTRFDPSLEQKAYATLLKQLVGRSKL